MQVLEVLNASLACFFSTPKYFKESMSFIFLFSLFISPFSVKILSLEEFDLHCVKVRSPSNKELIIKNRFISIFDVLNSEPQRYKNGFFGNLE